MEKTVMLRDEDWAILLDFAREKLQEIAEFDDEDEIYVAAMAVFTKIESQLNT
jgi:hypothetical protein